MQQNLHNMSTNRRLSSIYKHISKNVSYHKSTVTSHNHRNSHSCYCNTNMLCFILLIHYVLGFKQHWDAVLSSMHIEKLHSAATWVWMSFPPRTVQKDLKQHHLTLPKAADLAQNRLLWRICRRIRNRELHARNDDDDWPLVQEQTTIKLVSIKYKRPGDL